MSAYNDFDAGQIVERLCNWSEIYELVTNVQVQNGWHTWSHPDLTALAYQDVVREITPPFPMDYFCISVRKFNAHVIEAVRRAGFKAAWGVSAETAPRINERDGILTGEFGGCIRPHASGSTVSFRQGCVDRRWAER